MTSDEQRELAEHLAGRRANNLTFYGWQRLTRLLLDNGEYLVQCARFVEAHGGTVESALKSPSMLEPNPHRLATLEALAALRKP